MISGLGAGSVLLSPAEEEADGEEAELDAERAAAAEDALLLRTSVVWWEATDPALGDRFSVLCVPEREDRGLLARVADKLRMRVLVGVMCMRAPTVSVAASSGSVCAVACRRPLCAVCGRCCARVALFRRVLLPEASTAVGTEKGAVGNLDSMERGTDGGEKVPAAEVGRAKALHGRGWILG